MRIYSTEFSALFDRLTDIERKMTEPKFTFDRNGLRLAIAAIEDETGELYDEWNHNKHHLGNALHEIRHELLDIAAVAMATYARTFD